MLRLSEKILAETPRPVLGRATLSEGEEKGSGGSSSAVADTSTGPAAALLGLPSYWTAACHRPLPCVSSLVIRNACFSHTKPLPDRTKKWNHHRSQPSYAEAHVTPLRRTLTAQKRCAAVTPVLSFLFSSPHVRNPLYKFLPSHQAVQCGTLV
ncbi:hypothetical protein MHYP_G00107300 [Metynnis hypsauchen]